jgi:hypothetical protein
MDKRLPNIGEFVRGTGTLVDIQKPEPLPEPPPCFVFEEIEARYELLLGDEVIKTIATLNDFYGLGTSVSSAIKEAKQYAEQRHITKASDLEVRVVKVITRFKTSVVLGANYYDNQYPSFQMLRFGAYRDMPEPTELIVWSSKGIVPCSDIIKE